MSYVNLVEASESPNINYHPWQGTDGLGHVANFVWDVDTLAWIKQTAVNGNNPATEVTVLNFPATYEVTQDLHDDLNANANIQVGNTDVSGANPVPISAASLPLPSGAATSANQSTEITSLQLLDDTIIADNAAFTDGTTKVSMAGYIFDETAGTALTENDAGAARIDSKRAQVLVIEDTTTRGQRLSITAANAAKVDGSAVNQPIKQVQSSFDHVRKSSIGTTAVQITSTSTALIMGATVKAARTNAVRVFIGNSDVTADSTDSTDGMELGPGESVFIPVDNANKLYAIAESGSSAKVFMVFA